MGDVQRKTAERGTVLLVAFYNTKALGVRYLEGALRRAGYGVRTVFYQSFHSHCPAQTTQEELDLLCQQIAKERPILIGLSVMSSMYLETVEQVMDACKQASATPLVCGGAFASLFPDRFLDWGADYVIRGDGEIPLCQLADRLTTGGSLEGVPSLSFWQRGKRSTSPWGRCSRTWMAMGFPWSTAPVPASSKTTGW